MKTLSLVIPCFNESKNIPLLLNRCSEVVSDDMIEIILVDNGSTDDTSNVLDSLESKFPFLVRVRVEENNGYGHGILAGLEKASGKIIGWTHADMQTDPGDALKGLYLFQKSENPKELFLKGKRYGRPIIDLVFTIGMSVFETILLRKLMWDINAQPTMFHRDFYLSWSSPPDDFSLDLYAYFMAKKARLKVIRFPVLFSERIHGSSHWNINFSSKIKFIKRTLSYSINLSRRMKHNA